MSPRTIRVSEADDRKLWQLILKKKWNGTCIDPGTYVLTTDQLHLVAKAGIDFEELKPETAANRQAKRA